MEIHVTLDNKRSDDGMQWSASVFLSLSLSLALVASLPDVQPPVTEAISY